MSETSRRHYVIVVHGIGEQKLNQTTTPLIHRFAEVRNDKPGRYYNNLVPAYLSAQSVHRRGLGHGWSEFNGIPVSPNNLGETGVFDGTPATDTAGLNFRFVDLTWSHILQEHQIQYASSTEVWAEALRERLKQAPEGWVRPWASHLLGMIIDTAVPAKKILSFYQKELANKIFNGFLGDVHLYGDYARTRGQAVRHFHVILDEIHLRDFIRWYWFDRDKFPEYQEPEYTIIAHSLGSIMSFDALVYAHVKRDIRNKKEPQAHPSPSFPFPGYTDPADGEKDTWKFLMDQLNDITEDLKNHHPESAQHIQSPYLQQKIWNNYPDFHPDSIPPLQWRDCVKNFVTLGSPIDKYHVLWFQNYFHMGYQQSASCGTSEQFEPFPNVQPEWSEDWIDPGFHEPQIVHYNLCDEQDPVGHHLDVAESCKNYSKIFNTQNVPTEERDIVYRRYAVPGVAHVKYWSDKDLMQGIISEVIDKEPHGFLYKNLYPGKEGVYKKALAWAYFRIPFAAAMITGGLVAYGFMGLLPCLTGFGKECDPSLNRFVALIAAVCLWSFPNPKKIYWQESNPDETRKVGWWERWKPRRSILAHLVTGAVEWRRVLLQLSQDCPCSKQPPMTQKGFWGNAWIRYLGGTLLIVLFAVGRVAVGELSDGHFKDTIKQISEVGIIVSTIYVMVMVFVAKVFEDAKRKHKQV